VGVLNFSISFTDNQEFQEASAFVCEKSCTSKTKVNLNINEIYLSLPYITFFLFS
jgi:hypothetical protein